MNISLTYNKIKILKFNNMGCSCCYDNYKNGDSLLASRFNKRKTKNMLNNITNRNKKRRMESLGSFSSINFNNVVNITYQNASSTENEEVKKHTRLITDLSENYTPRRNNNINNNIFTSSTASIDKSKNYDIIRIKDNNENLSEKEKKFKKIFHLLSLFIQAKTGLINRNKNNQEECLIIKGLSQNSLDNQIIDTLNFNIKKIKKIYKNQKIPKLNSNDFFVDDLFPPNKDSILGIKNGKPVEKIKERLLKSQKDFVFDIDNIIWLRAEEIFCYQPYSIFVDDISINDVLQGYLGNCYFMSSLAAMTNIPQLICQIFKSLQISKNGFYEIGLNIEGQWQIVLLDDFFPCSKRTRVPIFAKPNGPELWVMLLEKAWAKINGGYLNIIGGYSSEVLSAFTSFPVETINLNINEIDLIWKKLQNAFEKGQIITCCSKFDDKIEKYGLISGHTFTVTNLLEGVIKNKLTRLIKLRNPWGYKEWIGDWSDHSNLWTEEAKKALNINLIIEDDGEFYMNIENFFIYFLVVDICRITNPQCVKSYKIPNENVNLPNVFEIQIFSKTNLIISALKKNYRFHRSLETNCELTINLILMKKVKNKLEFISSTNKNECNPSLNCELTVGFYLLYVYCNYDNSNYDKNRKVNIYISSNKYFFFYFKKIDTDFNLLKHLIYQMNEPEINSNNKTELPTLTSNKFESTTFGYLIIKNNLNMDIRLNIINQSENYDLFYPFKSSTLNIETLLFSGKVQIFLGIRKKYYERYNFELKIRTHVTPKEATIFTSILSTEKNEKINISPRKRQFLKRANFIKEGMIFQEFIDIKNIKEYLINIPDRDINKDEYDFIFKKTNIDKSKIIENIDYKKNAIEYFKEKYPDEMNLIIDEVEPLDDGEDVIFRDLFNYSDSYYLGEWKIKEELKKHGRGLLVNSNGTSYYLGQFQNDYQEGRGKFFFNKVEYIDINWVQGKMDGVGIFKRADGSIRNVYYKNGNKVSKEIFNGKKGIIEEVIY